MLTTQDSSHFHDFGLNDILELSNTQHRNTLRTSKSAKRKLRFGVTHRRSKIDKKFEGFHYYANWDRLPSVNTQRHWTNEKHFVFPSAVEKHCSLWISKATYRAPTAFHELIDQDTLVDTQLKTPKTKDW